MNPAKSLALRLAEHTPLLWGTDPLAAAVAEHAAAALATHAGVVAHAADIAQAATAGCAVRLTSRHRARHLPRPVRRRARRAEAPPPRLVLIGTAEEDPLHVALRRFGRGWPSADLLHPVDEVARGVRNAPLLRAGPRRPARPGRCVPGAGHPHDRPLPERDARRASARRHRRESTEKGAPPWSC